MNNKPRTPEQTEKKRQKEKAMVKDMIVLYCKKNHKHEHEHEYNQDGLCPECQALLDYAWMRSDKCPFMETKTFCSNCKVHCYKPDMRTKIQDVMRFAGPRMLFVHPIAAIHHVISVKMEKRRLEKEAKLKAKTQAQTISLAEAQKKLSKPSV